MEPVTVYCVDRIVAYLFKINRLTGMSMFDIADMLKNNQNKINWWLVHQLSEELKTSDREKVHLIYVGLNKWEDLSDQDKSRFYDIGLFDKDGTLIPFVWASAHHWYSSYTGADEAGYWKWIDSLETDEYYRWIGYYNDLIEI